MGGSVTTIHPSGTGDDLTADDSASVTTTHKEMSGIDDFPALPLPPGLTEKLGYKASCYFFCGSCIAQCSFPVKMLSIKEKCIGENIRAGVLYFSMQFVTTYVT